MSLMPLSRSCRNDPNSIGIFPRGVGVRAGGDGGSGLEAREMKIAATILLCLAMSGCLRVSVQEVGDNTSIRISGYDGSLYSFQFEGRRWR